MAEPKKIVFFAENQNLTQSEKTSLQEILTIGEKKFDIVVMSSAIGATDYENQPLKADFVFGADIPEAYEDVPVFDPESYGQPELPGDKVVMSDGELLSLVNNNGDTVMQVGIRIADGIADNAYMAEDNAVVKTGDVFQVEGGSVTVTVSNGELTFVFTPE